MPLAEGAVFAGYTVLRELGAGGMGEVYLVQHPRLPRHEALKVLPAELTLDHEYRDRFDREAALVATLWNPHIVAVHDRGEYEGQLWITMDYVDGTDAGRLLQNSPHGLPPDEVVQIVTGVADALDYAHENGMLHRDVKPANILLSQSHLGTRALLADFGIARRVDDPGTLTATNMTVGTVAYAAPEQLMGEVLDGRADQYALAATAFHLLTGGPPFQHSNANVVISKHLTAPPPAIDDRLPELSALGPVFRKALAKSADDRYESCGDFAEALARQLDVCARDLGAAEPTVSSKVSRPARRPWKRKVRWPVVAAAIVAMWLVVLSAVAVVAIWRRHHPAPQASATGSSAVPVVVLGADCATLGAAGVTTNGAEAYCAKMQSTNQHVWSLYSVQEDRDDVPSGMAPSPTALPGPTDTVYPTGLEQRVELCVQETGDTRQNCATKISQQH
ncbi:MAG: serine/threonine protein kinase [Mycobacteriaceae bacterium]|nr:serine/threonine protein kinase [Mycobacteriaceae bacterium]